MFIGNSALFDNFYSHFVNNLNDKIWSLFGGLFSLTDEMVVTLIILFIIYSIITTARLILGYIEDSNNLTPFIKVLNHSLANINDIGFITIALIAFFIVNVYFTLSVIDIFYNSFLVWVVILVVFIIIVLPFYILKNYGSYYLAFLRGSGSKKSFLWELLNDLIGIFSFFIRINIQLLRLLIATIFFAIMVEYWEGAGSNFHTSQITFELLTVVDYCLFITSSIFYWMFRLFYEIGHFWLLFFIQTTAFSMIIVILIQFLYACYLVDHLDNYFNKKRKNVKNK